MKICPSCKITNHDEEAHYCYICGSLLTAVQFFCDTCQRVLKNWENFCTNCGKKRTEQYAQLEPEQAEDFQERFQEEPGRSL